MKAHINEKLKETEAKYDIRILFACETGSRAWGFPSPDSDYDIRMVYCHEPDWYLTLSEKKDSIELMDGDLDLTGWDLRKSLRLMCKSNAAFLERVQSPIVYRQEEGMQELLHSYAAMYYAPVAVMHHYLGLAKNSFSEVEDRAEIKLKKLFYAWRSVLACKWIRQMHTAPPMQFHLLLENEFLDNDIRAKADELVALKSRMSEGYIHPQEKDLCAFIREELDLASEVAPTLKGRSKEVADPDELFRKILFNKL